MRAHPRRRRSEGRVDARAARTPRGRTGRRAGGGADARRRDGDRAVGSHARKRFRRRRASSRRIVKAGAAVARRGLAASATTTTRSSSARSTSGAGSSRPGWTSSSTSAGCGSRAATRSPSSRQHAGRLLLVHAKDVRPEGDGWLDVVAGDGELDFKAIAARRAAGGASHLVVELDTPSDDPVEDARRSLATLQGGDRMTDLGVGLVGCGKISGIYLDNAPRLDGVRFVACTDVDAERAQRGRRATAACARCSAEELVADPDVQVVLCLTPPDYHAEVMLQAIAAGKHVYTEKPLATSVDDARWVLTQAASAGVLVGSAPDTFLGAGHPDDQAGDRRRRDRRARRRPDPPAGRPAGEVASLPRVPVRRALRPADGPRARTPSPPRSSCSAPVANVTALATMPRTAGRDARRRRVPDRRADPRRRRARPRERRPDHDHDHRRRQRPGALRRRGPRPRRLAARRRPEHVRRPGRSSPAAASSTRRSRWSAQWNENSRGLGLQDLCRAVRDGTPQRASGELGLQVVETLLEMREFALDSLTPST